MDDLAAFSSSIGANLYVVLTPFRAEFRNDANRNLKNYYNLLDNLSAKLKFNFIDLSNNAEFVDQMFVDAEHLNSCGALVVSKNIIDNMRK